MYTYIYTYTYTCFLLSYIHVVQQIINENQWFICSHFDEFCAARHLEQGKPNSPIVNHPKMVVSYWDGFLLALPLWLSPSPM